MCLILLLARPVAAQVEGSCYNIAASGPWMPIDATAASPALRRPPPDQSDDSITFSVPTRIQLSGRPSRGGFTVEIPEGALQTPHRFRFWQMAADSLNLVFSTGFAGTRGNFGRSGSGWVGSLGTLSDQGGTQLYKRAFSLTQVDCNAPPPQPASLDRRLPRAIQLSSGQYLELGRALPAGISVVPRRLGALTVVAETAGLFAGADTVIALVNGEALVARVEVHYPSAFDLNGLVERIEAEFGPALSLGDRGAGWLNRTTTAYAFPSSAPGQAVRIILLDPRLGGG